MRKFMLVFISLASFFVFIISFNKVSREEFIIKRSITYNINEVMGTKGYAVWFTTNEKNKDLFFDELYSFIKNNKLIVSISEINQDVDYSNNNENIYLYFPSNIDAVESLYTIKERKNIDFSIKNDDYYTTNLEDTDSKYHIQYLDKINNEKYNGSINIYQFEKFYKSESFKNKQTFFIDFYVNDKGELKDKLESSSVFKYIQDENYLLEASTYEPENIEDTSINVVIAIIIVILLLGICNLVKKRKEIYILKSMGMKKVHILVHVYRNDFLEIVFTYFLIQVLCFACYVGFLNDNSIDFAIILVKELTVFIIFLILIGLFIYFLIMRMNDISEIKREKENHDIVFYNMFCKIVVILLILQPFYIQAIDVKTNTELFKILNKEKEKLISYIYLKGINVGEETEKYQFYNKLILEYFNDNGAYLQNFDTYYLSENLKQQGDENQSILNYPFPYMEANANYLKEYKLTDIEGNLIPIDKLKNRTLLVPEKYKNCDLSLYGGDEIIYISNGNIFNRYSIPTDYNTYSLKDPIIYFLLDLTEKNIYSGNYSILFPYNNQNEIKKLNSFLIRNNLKNKVLLGSNKDDYEIVYNYILKIMIRSWTMLMVQMFMFFILIFETVYMFIVQRKKLYILRYLFGYSFAERYGEIFIYNFTAYIICILIGSYLIKTDIHYLIASILLFAFAESSIACVFIKWFERKNAANYLKGEY